MPKQSVHIGRFAFDSKFRLAVDLMNNGALDLKPLVTDTLPFEQANEAFQRATALVEGDEGSIIVLR